MKNNRAALFKALTFIVLACFFLMVFSLYYTVKAYDFYRRNRQDYHGDSFIREDALIGFSQKGGIFMEHITAPAYRVYTDSRGARVSESRKGSAAPGHVDILATGCSFTWGHGVDDCDTFCRQIEKKTGLSVYNVGLASYGTTAALLSIDRFSDLKPGIVLYTFINDQVQRSMLPGAPCLSPYCRPVAFVDFDSDGNPFIAKPLSASDDYFRYMEEVMLDHSFGLKDIYWAVKRDMLFLAKKDRATLEKKYMEKAGDETCRRRAMEFLMDRMVARCRDMHARLVVCYVPYMGDDPSVPGVDGPDKAFLSAIKKHREARSLYFADTTGDFEKYIREKGKKPLMAGGVDGHPSPEGHRIIAEALIPLIRNIREKGAIQDSHRGP
ncbi:MAG: SGNH/GDSL hydrolase family protein [Candidatus Eremiobacteraeota bacterium]|nr:SGNH/GDSL hydrolase family protein [Candidatus Eremiobacteraeota bacterium]